MFVRKPSVPTAPVANAVREVARSLGRPMPSPETPPQPKIEER